MLHIGIVIMENTSLPTEILVNKNIRNNSFAMDDGNSFDFDKSPTRQEESATIFSTMQNFYHKIKKIISRNGKTLRSLKNFLLYAVTTAYFAWATYYFINQHESDFQNSFCTGYGFLMILFIFINIFVMYYCIIKPLTASHFIKLKMIITSQKIFKKRHTKICIYSIILIVILGYLIFDSRHNPIRLMSLSGIVVFLVLGVLFSKHPREIDWQPVIWGLILQFTFGLLTLRWKVGRNVFECIGNKTVTFLSYADYGSAFVYGDFLVSTEAVFVFKVLSMVYLLSLIVNILYYYGIMQSIMVFIGEFLANIMGTTICESVNCAANIFLSMTEAPFLIKPYLENLTESELHAVMTAGYASVSGSVLAAYISFGADPSYLITASVMSAPAALCYSKLVYPETKKPIATKEVIKFANLEYTSVLDAASKGAMSALELILGVSANLIAFTSFVYFTNGVLSWMGELVGHTGQSTWSVERFVGYVFMPFSFVMGVPWNECEVVGKLIGISSTINEFLAFKAMGEIELTPRAKIIATYSICNFANPSAIGIMISTFNTLMPSRREIVMKTVVRACIAGMMVCFMTACVAGVLVP